MVWGTIAFKKTKKTPGTYVGVGFEKNSNSQCNTVLKMDL